MKNRPLSFSLAALVLGQSSFNATATPASASSQNQPLGVAVDLTTGKVFVADFGNHRVLAFASASTLALNANAIRVIGQPNFNSKTNTTASTGLFNPLGVFVSAANTLFIADSFNNRVLGYRSISATASNATAANLVIGQAAFGSGGDGNAASQMFTPSSIFVDADDRLWVTDRDNRRVLRFNNVGSLPAANAPANGVLGQPGFQPARGTDSWRFRTDRLKTGKPNKFIIKAIGTNGLSSKRLKLKVRVETPAPEL